MKKFSLIFLVVFLSIQPVLAKDKVKKNSVKSAEDKVTLVCTLKDSKVAYYKGIPYGLGASEWTLTICNECTLNNERWQISPADYSVKYWERSGFNVSKEQTDSLFTLFELRINRYTGMLYRGEKLYTLQDENSQFVSSVSQEGTCKKVEAPLL